MIRYLKHPDVNKAEWDRCIASSSAPLIYGYSWYLDIVCPGWEALVESDENSGTHYNSAMPLTANKKYGINYLYQPFFTQQLGLFSSEPVTHSKLLQFLSAIPARFRLIEINLNTANPSPAESQVAVKHTTYQLELRRNYTEIAGSYSENTRRNLKKSTSKRLLFRQSSEPEKIIQLFRANRGKNISTLGPRQYELLEKLLRELSARDCLRIKIVESPEAELFAGAFFAEHMGRSVFLFSGSNAAARENGAMFYLIDRYLSENAQSLTSLDFNGSNDANLARFYSGFGSHPQTYFHLQKNKLPRPLPLIMRIFK